MEELFPGAGDDNSSEGEPEPPDTLRLDIHECAGCGSRHFDVEVHKVSRGEGVRFTHAFWCERSKTRVLVRVEQGPQGA